MYDLEKLYTELPTHPLQLWIKSEHEKKAKAYWDKIRENQNHEPDDETDGAYISVGEAMATFSVSYETIRRWGRSSQVGTRKENGRLMVNLNDLHRYVRCYAGQGKKRRMEYDQWRK